MTARDIDNEIQNGSTGRIMQRLRTSGFKIVVVLGASRAQFKVRICVWSAVKKRWSLPQLSRAEDLQPVPQENLTARQKRVIADAISHIDEHHGSVVWARKGTLKGSGAERVGKAWTFRGGKPRPPAPAGVTKLPSVIAVAGTANAAPLVITPESKSKLQKLNQSLSNFMFGGKKP